jgi:putative transposase
MKSIQQNSEQIGVADACDALDMPRAGYYRWLQRQRSSVSKTKRISPRRLSDQERREILTLLTDERFMELAVPEVYYTLLDEGKYLCSWRTMYRILNETKAVKERRNQRRNGLYAKPELLATAPNQLWSWDITKLKGPQKWNHYNLYVIMDVYSRYVVGWLIAERESATLAKRLIEECCRKQNVHRDQLTIHADRGSAMRSKTVAQLMADLGITKTHSRPHVSNDNPYSEAQFKTLKYHSSFPGKFGSLEDARSFLRTFFDWYNNHHRHSGIAMMTAADVHTGNSENIYQQRQQVLRQAHQQHPERFVKGQPQTQPLPKTVWINKPHEDKTDAA